MLIHTGLCKVIFKRIELVGKCGFNYVGVGEVGRHPGNNGKVRTSRNKRTSECSTRSITRVYAPTHTVARTFTFNTGSIPTDSQPRPASLPPRSTLCRPFLTASSMSSILHCHSTILSFSRLSLSLSSFAIRHETILCVTCALPSTLTADRIRSRRDTRWCTQKLHVYRNVYCLSSYWHWYINVKMWNMKLYK